MRTLSRTIVGKAEGEHKRGWRGFEDGLELFRKNCSKVELIVLCRRGGMPSAEGSLVLSLEMKLTEAKQ
jgi:hypothetical protein